MHLNLGMGDIVTVLGTCSESENSPDGMQYSLTDVAFGRLFRWPIVRTADVEADVECYRLSTE